MIDVTEKFIKMKKKKTPVFSDEIKHEKKPMFS